MSDLITAKRDLRRKMSVDRRAVSDPAVRSSAICRRLQDVPGVASATTIMLYSAVRGEPELGEFEAWCRSRRISTVVPMPERDADYPIDPRLVDVVIVPGLAFTPAGERLGQGGGWYDGFLSLVRSECLTIGVCFGFQVVESLPTEPHDRRVGVVVTDVDVG